MDLRQLRYFIKIVELESISAAANALFIAQPSLSQHVANLEADLGTRLLNRSTHGTRPTSEGELLFQYAKAILRQVDEAERSIKSGRVVPSGLVSLGLSASTMRVIGFELLRQTRQKYPEIRLQIHEGSTADLIDKLSRQQMDLCIAPEVQPNPAFDCFPIIQEDLLAIGPAEPEGGPGELSLAEVLSHPLILPPMPNSVRARIEQACAIEGTRYELIAESSVVSLLTSAATSGLAWSILPWGAIVDAHDALAAHSIRSEHMHRRLYLCMSKAATTTSACKAVSDLICDVAQDFIHKKAWRHARLLG